MKLLVKYDDGRKDMVKTVNENKEIMDDIIKLADCPRHGCYGCPLDLAIIDKCLINFDGIESIEYLEE